MIYFNGSFLIQKIEKVEKHKGSALICYRKIKAIDTISPVSNVYHLFLYKEDIKLELFHTYTIRGFVNSSNGLWLVIDTVNPNQQTIEQEDEA